MTNDIEQWKIEFKKFTDGFDLYGNEWQDMGCDQVFKAGFDAAKRAQKPIELPRTYLMDDPDGSGRGEYLMLEMVENRLEKAGIKYTVNRG